jgi:phage tail-like protein
MAKFTGNPTRFDPYKNFKFRIKFGAKRYVAGASKIRPLEHTIEVEHREGSDPSSSLKSPGRIKFEAITVESGVTYDPEFEQWANKVRNFRNAHAPADLREKEVPLKDFRRNLTIDLFNEAGQKVLSYKVYGAWVSEFTGAADLDANANAILIEAMKIEHEGWERDTAVKEPSEPDSNDPEPDMPAGGPELGSWPAG